MPFISRTTAALKPDIFNIPNQSDIFTRVYVLSLSEYAGTILPPTDIIITEWNSINQDFMFSCTGVNIEECKLSLETNWFPCIFSELGIEISDPVSDPNKIKVVTWTRMIMAFNMYAYVRKHFNSPPYNKIDLIGSKINTIPNRSKLRNQFDNVNVLYIPDDILHEFIENTKYGRIINFWRLIFDTYDNQIDIYDNLFINEHPIPDNWKIANMILQSECLLPHNVRKMIYDVCMAFHISHPIE